MTPVSVFAAFSGALATAVAATLATAPAAAPPTPFSSPSLTDTLSGSVIPPLGSWSSALLRQRSRTTRWSCTLGWAKSTKSV